METRTETIRWFWFFICFGFIFCLFTWLVGFYNGQLYLSSVTLLCISSIIILGVPPLDVMALGILLEIMLLIEGR